MTRIETDICVIGAGSGGLSVAAGAVQMGARVVLIEAGEMGGDCLNTGCVPSKALLAAGNAAQALRRGGPGVAGVAPRIDYAAAKDHVARAIATIAPHDSQQRFECLGCTVIRARARFAGPREVEAGGTRITARRFVIATGSRPAIPPIPGLSEVAVLTNETIFDLRVAPRHLVIIGGGPIGLEMAQAHLRLGCAVSVIEAGQILAREDAEARDLLRATLLDEGLTLLEGASARHVHAAGDQITVETDQGPVTGSHLLVATGRRVDLRDMGLEAAGVDYDEGGVVVDAGLRSRSNRRVYAVGDAAGQGQFTHLAGYHGGLILRPMLFGLPARARTDHIPRVTYTAPELAQVGLTEDAARARHGAALRVIREDLASNDRAVTEGLGAGFLKLMVVGGRPVGVTLVGPHAGDLIAPWAMMIAGRHKLTAMTSAVLPYPTLGEINKRAAGAYFTPKLFDNIWVKRAVGVVQRLLP